MNTIQEIIGMNLKYYRYKSGLSQEKFYEQFGLNPKYLASVERGEINISVEFLANLSRILKIDIREFLILMKVEQSIKKELMKKNGAVMK